MALTDNAIQYTSQEIDNKLFDATNGAGRAVPGNLTGATVSTTAFPIGLSNGGTLRHVNGDSGGNLTIVPIPSSIVTAMSLYSNTALTNTFATVKSSAARLFDIHVYNPNASVSYIQFFSNAAPTVGTTTPLFVIGVPPNGAIDHSMMYAHSTAVACTIAATTTPTGSTAPATACNVTIGYA